MVGTGVDRPIGCEVAGGGGRGQIIGEVRRRDGAVGDNGKELTTWDIM